MFHLLCFVLLATASLPCFAMRTLHAGQGAEYDVGKGYDSEKEIPRGKCIEPVIGYQGRPDANVNYSQKIEQKRLAAELGFGASGSAKYGISQFSAAANFYKSSTQSSFSISAVYSGDYKFENQILSSWKLSPEGQSVKSDFRRWRATCGNEFVEQIGQGAKLFFSIKIDFASAEDKSSFDTAFSFSSNFASAHAYLKQNSQNFSKNTQVTIGAYQLGGQVDKITNIFRGTNPTGNESIGFVRCTMGKFDECDAVLARAIEYAVDTDAGFPSQLRTTNATNPKTYRANLFYYLNDYISLGLFSKFDPIMERAIISARDSLEKPFLRHLELLVQVRSTLDDGVVKISPRQKKLLEAEAEKLSTNVDILTKAAQTCYERPEDCIAAATEALDRNRGISNPDPSVLNITPETYLQYCYLAPTVSATADLKDTINGILEAAKAIDPNRFVNSGTIPLDVCSQSHTILRNQSSLNLAKRNIKTLKPLMDLTHLREIDLNENSLSSLTGLEELVALERLNLGRNKLTNIDAVKNLSQLQWLNLEGNRLRDISKLDTLPQLTYVDLQNNLGATCPKSPNLQNCLTTSTLLEIGFTGSGALGIEAFFPTASKLTDTLYGITMSSVREGEAATFAFFDLATQVFSLGPQPQFMRIGHSQVTLNDGRLVISGGERAATKIEYLEPNGVWKTAPLELKNGRRFHNSTLLEDGRILITGGFGAAAEIGLNPLQTAEIIDPKTWTSITLQLQNPRGLHTTTRLDNGRILLIGSWSSADASPTAEIVDTKSATSKLIAAKMAEARGGHTANLIGNRVLISGGFAADGLGLTSLEVLDLQKLKFTTLPQGLAKARGLHTSSLLAQNRIVLVGGTKKAFLPAYPTGATADCQPSAELIDINKGSVTPVRNSMHICRIQHGQIQLSDSAVMFFGGSGFGSLQSYDTLQYQEIEK